MRITKLGHACVRLEHDGHHAGPRPGGVHRAGALDGADAVLITHEHPDHYLPDHLRASDAAIFTIEAVAARIREDAPDVAERVTVVAPGESFDAGGLPVRAVGERHAVIHPELPRFDNSGYVVTLGETLVYHPGDALTGPGEDVDVLLPAGLRALAEGLRGDRLRPRGGRPAQPRDPRPGLLRGRPGDRGRSPGAVPVPGRAGVHPAGRRRRPLTGNLMQVAG